MPLGQLRNTSEDSTAGGSSPNPEALLVSAYLQQGRFTPDKHNVSTSDITCWGRLWKWALDYQQSSNRAPTPALVKKYFPEFIYIPDVNPDWAAAQVRTASASRELRTQIHTSLEALNAEDLDSAYAAISSIKRPVGRMNDPVDVFDHSTVAEFFEVSRIPVPFPSLIKATDGGIAPSEFWVIGARLGHGKTWLMLMYAACAAKAGYNVGFHALEMPAWQVARRTHQLMAPDKETLSMLRSKDVIAHKKAVDRIRDKVPGSIQIFDPSHGRINTTRSIQDSCRKYDLVLVDHAGLLQSGDGHRAIEDWRQMATISNVCREIVLSTGTPLIVSAQVNRAGESNGIKPPKAANLSQSDALGQDADVVLTMKRINALVMSHSGQKIRNGPNIDWFTRFDPAGNKFEEITRAQADRLSLEAEDIANR